MRFLCLAFIVLLLADDTLAAVKDWQQKSFSYTNDKYCPQVKFDTDKSDLSLTNLATTGANYVSIITTYWQKTIHSTEIGPTNVSATDAAIVHAIKQAHKLGLKVMLKPHVDLTEDPQHWRGDIGGGFDDDQWASWFSSYSKYIVHIAEIGQSNGVEIVSLGCELTVASKRDAEWRVLAKQVRNVFSKAITFSSNWGGGETNITWWDVVDFIGVDAYYPMAPTIKNPTLQDYVNFWDVIVTKGVTNGVHGGYMQGGLLNLTQFWKKPLAFTETGACSGDCTQGHTTDFTHQNMYLQSIFEYFGEKPWFLGMHWWNWVTDPAFGGMENVCMSPAFKPAEAIFRRYFGGNGTSVKPAYAPACPCIL